MDEEQKRKLNELLVQLAGGNINALHGISESVQKIVMSIGCYYYRNKQDAEDSVQDLYITLKSMAIKFKPNTNGYAWIVRIFQNAVKSNLRRRKREKEILEEYYYTTFGVTVVDDKYIENHLFLREIFDQITEEERQLVIYYHWCGCTVRETAKILHKPSSTIYNKLKALEEKVKKIKNS